MASLRAAGAREQAAALAVRLPAVGMFGLFLEQEGRADQFRFGREPDGTPAALWDWETWTYHWPLSRGGAEERECSVRGVSVRGPPTGHEGAPPRSLHDLREHGADVAEERKLPLGIS